MMLNDCQQDLWTSSPSLLFLCVSYDQNGTVFDVCRGRLLSNKMGTLYVK